MIPPPLVPTLSQFRSVGVTRKRDHRQRGERVGAVR